MENRRCSIDNKLCRWSIRKLRKLKGKENTTSSSGIINKIRNETIDEIIEVIRNDLSR